jgi:hypothetical protein
VLVNAPTRLMVMKQYQFTQAITPPLARAATTA